MLAAAVRQAWRWLHRFLLLVVVAAMVTTAANAQEEEHFFGWAGEEEAAAALQGFGDEIKLYGATADDYRRAVDGQYVCLWEQTKAVLQGRHLPTRKQQIGDCVSWGFGHAVEYSLAVHLSVSSEGGRFVEVCKPYLYGTGRVFVGGGRLGGDGSTGAWQSRALEEYGVLAIDAEGCPPYSGAVARQWGARPGPPERFVAVAKRYRAECKLVTTWADAAVSISKGAPVAVCSGYGFRIQVRNQRVEGYRSGSWPHCMCFIAVDGRPGREALYCLNSWGENAHAPAADYARLDGAPPGGFWVLKSDVEGMLRSRDSYSVRFTGFVDRAAEADRLYGLLEGGSDEVRGRVAGVRVVCRLPLGGADLRPVALGDEDDDGGRTGGGDWTRRVFDRDRARELRRLRLPGGLPLAG